ncbi:MAG: COQ9 family protein [Sphingomonadaceae bacterium]|nr:COQ9 family protein [Sphingomonadaceae bacterium]
MSLPPDPTLDEMRAALGPRLPAHAVFDGWSDAALARAAEEIGVDPAEARLAFGGDRVAMIDAWFASIDAAMAEAFTSERIATMKIRARIRELVLFRLAAAQPHREAARSALAILAMPRHAAAATRLGWRAADAMWRAAGDTSADIAWYTKRTTLAAVYVATLLVWLNDDSEGQTETRAFLDRRIDNVMQFEKLKARLRPDPERRFSIARFLGRLRYPPA